MSKRCKKCGKLGHNSRTCGKEKNKIVKKKGVRICSHCGLEGHNVRTCPVIHGVKEVVVKVSNRVCSYCGEKGHNRRTCLRIKTVDRVAVDEKVDYIKTKFKDEDDFLNSVLGVTYEDAIIDIKNNIRCISVIYYRDKGHFKNLEFYVNYYFMVDKQKYIEIVKVSRDEYTIRRGTYGKSSKMKIKCSDNVDDDIKKYISHYSSYKLVYGV